jgi:hypothetical protein
MDEILKIMPEEERRKFLAEQEKERRMDLRELKINDWKKRRNKDDKKSQSQENREDLKIEKIEEHLERLKAEAEKR